MAGLKAYGAVARPRSVLLALVVSNLAMYALCVRQGGQAVIPLRVLVADGALIPGALQPGEWWRLVAAGFLHANPAHLLSNLFSLFVVGPFLERRIGPSLFAFVYALALVGGSVTSLGLHGRPFVGVGASGAIFGLMGALSGLWVLGAKDVSPRLLVVNLALNVALAARGSGIDWAAHAGGFVAGLIAVAVLDLVARTNRFWLVCKFPEFVRGNVLLWLALGGACLWASWSWIAGGPALLFVVAGVGPAALSIVKLMDVLLAARHGLVAIVLAFAAGNAVLVTILAALAPSLTEAPCRMAAASGALDGLSPVLCGSNASVVAGTLAALVTVAAYSGSLRRGMGDVGFVGASLKAERQRERGLAGVARRRA